MAQRTPGALIRLWFEDVWNQRAADRIATHRAPHGVIRAADVEGWTERDRLTLALACRQVARVAPG
jgi:hypothetical protein